MPDPEQYAFVNVARYLPLAAEQEPERCAVRVPRTRRENTILYDSRTFSELNEQSDALAHMLVDAGIERGMRTLLMVKPGMDLILMVFAMFKVGAVPVVIDPGMGLKSFRDCVLRTAPEAMVGIPLAQIVRRVFKKDFFSIRHSITVGTSIYRSRIRKFMSRGVFPMAQTRENELAAILFTSGSTGAPKGVCYEHGMFQAQVDLIRKAYRITPGEVDLPLLPVFALFNPALGTTTIVPQMNPSKPASVDPLDIITAIDQNKVTYSFGSPVLWTKIARYCEANKVRLYSLRRILMAGAPVPPALIRLCREVFPNAEVHTPYGATECLPISTISGPEILEYAESLSLKGKGSCVGRVYPEVDIKVIQITDKRIARVEDATLCGTEEVGELIVTGPVVTKEYDQLPEATAMSKLVDGKGRTWHRMGDLGYFDALGFLWFCGRKAERVEGQGKIWFTDCCEAIINRHPQVFRSALIGLGKRGKQIPAIVVEPEPEHWPRSAKEREAFAASLLKLAQGSEVTKEITRFYFYEKFPVDVRHNAKIHRLTLARHFSEQEGMAQ